MTAGLASAHHFGTILHPALFAPPVAAAFAASFLRSRLPLALLILSAFFVWGSASLSPFIEPRVPADHLSHVVSSNPVIVEGVVDSRPEADGEGAKLTLRAERILRDGREVSVSGRLLLFAKEGRGTFLAGDRVRFEARLRYPENFGLPGEFDYRRYLAYRSIFVTAFVPRADHILLMREGVAFPVQRWFDRLARELGEFIGSRFPVEGGVLRALLVGERGFVPDHTEEAYARAGVNHILSISGFHVGVIALTLYHLLFRLLSLSESLAMRFNLRRVVLFATLPPVFFYLLLAGLAPATVRSVLMIAVVTLALILERETDSLNTLILAAVGILVVTPQALFDISFQLSFLALWGIMVLSPLIMESSAPIPDGVGRKLLLFVAASVAAIVSTLLPVVHSFHRASMAGLIGNIIAVPLLGYGAVVAGFAALPLIPVFPSAAGLLLGIAAWMVKISDGFIAAVAQIPPFPLRSATRIDLLVLYLALLAVSLVKGRRTRFAICGAAAAIVIVFHLPVASASGKLRITFFSVGQGESTLITFPDGRTMLVDGGGSPHEGGMDVGARLLAPALWCVGVDSLDYVVLTHPHPDHMKGLVSLAAIFPIGQFWEGGTPAESGDYTRLRGILAARGVPVLTVNGTTAPMSFGGAWIEPLGPQRTASDNVPRDVNDDSLVFRLVFGDFSMLFTGDIGYGEEYRLQATPARLRSTVLKVPHHGSRHSSSSAFLDAVSPRLALISAGVRNSFGLPSPETLSRLQERGIAVYRTDRDKTIQVESSGTGYHVKTFAEGHFH
ncbi:MAG: DNA internalization-related competence protein ComEC/Rec2 [Desulfuromonadales bacterium]|nr:MAG: DNA internalization-related competence protein ComEC/Rec2 [Desulfuromonadales bacterium]